MSKNKFMNKSTSNIKGIKATPTVSTTENSHNPTNRFYSPTKLGLGST